MRSTLALSVAALAGAALAAPHYGGPVENVHWKIETVYHTVYQPGSAQPTPVPAAPQYEAPAAPADAPAPAAPAEAPAPAAPAEAPAAAPSPPSYQAHSPAAPSPAAPSPAYSKPSPAPEAPSTNSGYMGVVDKWRKKLGLKALQQDSKLQSNALNCVTESNGQMVHKLNPGSYGQVLAPGTANEFEHVFVGGWLCEIATLPGLDGACDSQSKGWTYEGQTGHAKILTDPQYTKIGCALYNGIWGCDLGY